MVITRYVAFPKYCIFHPTIAVIIIVCFSASNGMGVRVGVGVMVAAKVG